MSRERNRKERRKASTPLSAPYPASPASKSRTKTKSDSSMRECTSCASSSSCSCSSEDLSSNPLLLLAASSEYLSPGITNNATTGTTTNNNKSCMTPAEFDSVLSAYTDSLHPRKIVKALINREMYDKVHDTLRFPGGAVARDATPQFRYWARKMFVLAYPPGYSASSGSGTLPGLPPSVKAVLLHENRPVAIKEDLYGILVEAHGSSGHSGRDRTCKVLRGRWSYVPKVLVAGFVARCGCEREGAPPKRVVKGRVAAEDVGVERVGEEGRVSEREDAPAPYLGMGPQFPLGDSQEPDQNQDQDRVRAEFGAGQIYDPPATVAPTWLPPSIRSFSLYPPTPFNPAFGCTGLPLLHAPPPPPPASFLLAAMAAAGLQPPQFGLGPYGDGQGLALPGWAMPPIQVQGQEQQQQGHGQEQIRPRLPGIEQLMRMEGPLPPYGVGVGSQAFDSGGHIQQEVRVPLPPLSEIIQAQTQTQTRADYGVNDAARGPQAQPPIDPILLFDFDDVNVGGGLSASHSQRSIGPALSECRTQIEDGDGEEWVGKGEPLKVELRNWGGGGGRRSRTVTANGGERENACVGDENLGWGGEMRRGRTRTRTGGRG